MTRPIRHRERVRRRRLVDAFVEEYGLWCPGWRRPAHAVTSRRQLSADHVTPVGPPHYGPEDGPLQVLCLVCNGRRGSRPNRPEVGRSVRRPRKLLPPKPEPWQPPPSPRAPRIW